MLLLVLLAAPLLLLLLVVVVVSLLIQRRSALLLTVTLGAHLYQLDKEMTTFASIIECCGFESRVSHPRTTSTTTMMMMMKKKASLFELQAQLSSTLDLI